MSVCMGEGEGAGGGREGEGGEERESGTHESWYFITDFLSLSLIIIKPLGKKERVL